MANTYTQIHLQFVFAVRFRASLIDDSWKNELYKYMTGIVHAHNHKLLIVNGMPDHIHMLVGMRPTQSIAELLQDIKGDSSKWINEKKLSKSRFEWQQGYGAFSYSKNQLPQLIHYIARQEDHHRRTSFLQEYRELLQEFDVSFEDRYIFKAAE